jgi:membrane-bound lytic murein transglycosylase B
MKVLALLLLLLSGPAFATSTTSTTSTASITSSEPQNYQARDDVAAFIEEMHAKYDFAPEALRALFAETFYQPSIIKAITPLPSGRRSWKIYRGNFVNENRIARGLRFWRDNEATLIRAEQTYGVPREIIAAIIGIETEFGRNMGNYRVMDALSTLGFDYPRRAEFFRGELAQLLLLARESNIDPLELKSSFAGAIGIPQFMPSSTRRYAVDFDGDGRLDLRASAADAIGSVANFLQQHGWQSGGAIAAEATLGNEDAQALISDGVEPERPVRELRAAGVQLADTIDDNAMGVLIELQSRDAASEYLVGLHNFYVITRYNRSSFYAAAVLQLAQALNQRATLLAN